VKNPNVPLLTLQSQPYTVRISYSSKPDIVTLTSPPDGSVNVQTNATATWGTGTQAAAYHFQLARDSGFATTVVDTTISTTSVGLKGLSTSTKFYWRVSASNTLGSSAYSRFWSFTTSSTVSAIADLGGELPRQFHLDQNYPNPFNPSTVIRFALPNENHVRVGIYTILGQLVGYLVDGDFHAGSYTVRWDASGYASGVYLYRIQAGTYSDTKKLFLLK
jgi:hypothetical protein